MKLPRDLSGHRLVRLLERYGYEITRQTGSHIRLTSSAKGGRHHVSIPAHRVIKVGTLSGILAEVALYYDIDKEQLSDELFGG